jgi:hypothetical protein
MSCLGKSEFWGFEKRVGNWRPINHPIACQFSTLALADTLHGLLKIVSFQQFLDAFIESGELVDIWNAFAGHSNRCVLLKIPAAVKGHPDPAHQKAIGPEPRDTCSNTASLPFCEARVYLHYRESGPTYF